VSSDPLIKSRIDAFFDQEIIVVVPEEEAPAEAKHGAGRLGGAASRRP
jgi:hypothetical protein